MGVFDVFVAACYVTFLGVIGTLMMIESANTIRQTRAGRVISGRRPAQHNWVHGLPLKMRFNRSKLYISAIPPLLLGLFVGLLAAIMGVGGGFIMVPAMIYLSDANQRRGRDIAVPDRVPDRGDHGAACLAELQRRCRAGDDPDGRRGDRRAVRRAAGERLKGEQLRVLLSLMVLAVGVKLAYDLVTPPAELFTLSDEVPGSSRRTAWRGAALAAALAAVLAALPSVIDGPRAAEVVVAGLSHHDVSLTTGFTGSELFVFGAVRRTDARPEPAEKLDVIIAITGPSEPVVVRRKERRFGIWANGPGVLIDAAPSFYVVATTRGFRDIMTWTDDLRYRIDLGYAITLIDAPIWVENREDYHIAVARIREQKGTLHDPAGRRPYHPEHAFRDPHRAARQPRRG